jgi:hypothetical protein
MLERVSSTRESTLILNVRFNLDLSFLCVEEVFYSEGVQVVSTVMLLKI